MIDKNSSWLRAPKLRIQISSGDEIIIRINNEDHFVPFHGLRILDYFSRPRIFGEAVEALSTESAGAQDWIDVSNTILAFIKAGVLLSADDTDRLVEAPDAEGFGAAPIHIKMLNDRQRTSRYLDAIRRSINAGDIAVDVGTGTGVLAVAAAQAGARHVYAIEATAIGRLANMVFRANNVEDRVTLVPGWSTQVEIPQRADVIISELIGNSPFSERVLEAIIDARKRFGRPSVRMLPANMTVFARPVTLPESIVHKHCFDVAVTKEWQRRYGIDFAPLAEAPINRPKCIHVNADDIKQCSTLAGSTPIVQIDFSEINNTTILKQAVCEVEADGVLNGVVVYFTLGLADGVTLTMTPETVDINNSWNIMAWLLPEPLLVKQKQRLELQFAYNSPGIPDGATARLID